MYYFLLLIAGLVGGVLAGLFGIGGGAIYTQVLEVYLPSFGVQDQQLPQFIIANSYVCIFLASITSSVTLIKLKQFYYKPVIFISLTATSVAWFVYEFIVKAPWFSKPLFYWIDLILLVYMVVSVWTNKKKEAQVAVETLTKKHYFLSGFLGGAVSALSGFGGGIVMVPLLNGIFKIDFKKAKSISMGVISVMALFMTLYNAFQIKGTDHLQMNIGVIIYPVVLIMSLGVITASYFATQWAQKVENKKLIVAYVCFMIVFISRNIWMISHG